MFWSVQEKNYYKIIKRVILVKILFVIVLRLIFRFIKYVDFKLYIYKHINKYTHEYIQAFIYVLASELRGSSIFLGKD